MHAAILARHPRLRYLKGNVFGPLATLLALVVSLGLADAAAFVPREVEFPFDDAVRLQPGEINGGKVWRSHDLPVNGGPVALVVFVHGIVFDGKRHHWLTRDDGGPWDARPFMDDLVDSGQVTPLVVAVPSQTRDAWDPSRLFVDLDFVKFVDAVDGALAPFQRVDRERIVLIGHSGAACEHDKALYSILGQHGIEPLALIAVDGCLAPWNGTLLSTTAAARNVIVTYQDLAWTTRTFDEFRAKWNAGLTERWRPGLRVLERFSDVAAENAHLELVEKTVRRWLPALLPAARRALVTEPALWSASPF